MNTLRPLLVCLALLGAGCPSTASEDLAADPDGPPNQGAAAECAVAADCTAAGDSCCDCPSFAVPKSSGWDDGCEDVTCDAPADCSTEPACDDGTCVLRCIAVACPGDRQCPGGFAVDEAGCTTCDCAAEPDPAAPECELDSDCAQVPADCCGCARGGSDTAVPADQVSGFLGGLDCDGSLTCPEIDVCEAAAAPRCVSGVCQLVADPGGGAGEDPDAGADSAPQLCGTPDLPPCPNGQSCVVNDADAEAGAGVCRP